MMIFMGGDTFIAFGVISLILAILCMIFVVPRSRKPYLNGFFQWLHEVFNFDKLLIETILKFLYIFSTFAVIFLGFLTVIEGFRYLEYTGEILLYGFLLMVLGPFAVRLIYELLMMMVILVKHVVEINRKMKNENPENAGGDPFASGERAARPAAATCPGCGAKMRPGARFCGVCGYRKEDAPTPESKTPTKNYYPTDVDL